MHPMVLQGDVGHVESRFGPFGGCVSVSLFETVLVLVQDKCTVCAKYTIGLEIILDAPDGTPR
jgi:hypothetical protein